MSDEKTPIESKADHGKGDRALAVYWTTEIDLYEQRFKPYLNRCTRILDRYTDKKALADELYAEAVQSANFLWAGMNIILPATQSRRPKPVVRRRFADRDDVSRVACMLSERCLTTAIDCKEFDSAVKRIKFDFLLLARGVGFIRYKPIEGQEQPSVSDSDSSAGDETEQPQPFSYLAYEKVYLDYIHRGDFGHTSGARWWEEVSATWKVVYLSRDELVRHFGQKIGGKVPLDYEPAESAEEKTGKSNKWEHFKKAKIYEVYDAAERKTYWFSKGYTRGPLKVVDDMLSLEEHFFPFPQPAYGTLTNDSLIPLPDPAMAQSLYDEIDYLSAQITQLTSMVKIVGAFDGSAEELHGLLKAENGTMVGVKNWVQMKKGGGANAVFEVLDITPIVAALKVLYEAREIAKQLLYEVTGNSDIMRGATDARETLGAQRMKMQNASMRLSEKQNELNRFLRDALEIMWEIIVEKFSDQTILAMANAEAFDQNDQRLIPAALQLLRQDTVRGFKIEIETDSTIAQDEEEAKAAMTELLNSLGQFFERAVPLVQQMPPLGSVMKEILMMTVRNYRAGRAIEDEIERAMDEVLNMAQQAQQQQPAQDPDMVKVQQDGQIKQQQLQMEGQFKGQELQMKHQAQIQELQLKLQEAQANAAVKQQEMEQRMALKWAELEERRERAQLEWQGKQEQALAQLLAGRQDAHRDHQFRQQESAQAAQLQREQMAAAGLEE